uniref:SEC7 domain-containing protein n=1 Tax=Onchocerca volvulus TaxID=6282 RepID=A0A8R1TV30_ONCVO
MGKIVLNYLEKYWESEDARRNRKFNILTRSCAIRLCTLMAYFNTTDLTPAELEDLAFLRARRSGINEDVEEIRSELDGINAQLATIDIPDEEYSPNGRHMSIARKNFNIDPKKGMEYMIQHNLVHNSSASVAEFLYKGEGLRKSAVGDYLGENNPFNLEVLEKFCELHDFTDLILVQALRQFFWSFRLPGESQKIDRMVNAFARRYCANNPGVFSSIGKNVKFVGSRVADTCYILCFAIVMLNTALHNRNVKTPLTLDGFITMYHGIDEGRDVPRELLESIYESIRTEPFQFPTDDGEFYNTFFNPDREGWLLKQASSLATTRPFLKSWKRRWFILAEKCLYYFEHTTAKEPRGIIPLENVHVRAIEEKGKPYCFEIYSDSSEIIKACKTEPDGRMVVGRHTSYKMCTFSQEEMNQWISAIERSINYDPFYQMLQLKKMKLRNKT